MWEDPRFQKVFWALLGLLIGTIVFCWVFGGLALGFNASWDEDFESYGLSDLNGQGNWAGSPVYDVSYCSSEGAKGVSWDIGAIGYETITLDPSSDFTSGVSTYKMSFKPTYWSSFYTGSDMGIGFYNGDDEFVAGFDINRDTETDEFCISAFNQAPAGCWDSGFIIDKNDWVDITIELDLDNKLYTINAETGLDTMEEEADISACGGADPCEVHWVDIRSAFEFDGCFDDFIYIPPETDIWASSPASGTIITEEGTSFTFNWQNITAYDYMGVGFNNRATGISSDYIYYDIDSLTETSTTTTLDAFNIDKNGDWYFQGFLTNFTAEVYDDVFFTGRYVSESTEDLAYTDHYYLTFSITGYETMTSFPTFTDWYAENSTRYESPTDMFVAITDLFIPIFNKVGEFGQRIEDFFNLDEAYANGYDIGKSIPIFGYYIGQTAYFFGNFPFIKWVFIVLLFFIGVFLFRFVIKFIPFLGG